MRSARSVLLVSSLVFLLAGAAHAVTIPLALTPGPTVGDTLVFTADLTGLGLTQIASIDLVDDGIQVGGSPGIFSGFDVDAIFLDVDGNLATLGDRFFGTSFLFSAGTTRPTADPSMLPNGAHPGPTFGSLDASTVDLATATLNTLDGVSVANVNLADGFLTLGDGGTLSVGFAPPVGIAGTLFLAVGEVGGQPGEGIGASITVSDEPQTAVPEPSAVVTFGIGALLVGLTLRRRA